MREPKLAGSGYDVYARQLSPYLARHIIGNPNVVVKNMDAVRDPAYVSEAQALGMLVDPANHVAMEKLINDTYSIPHEVIVRALAMVDKAKITLGAPPQAQ